MFSVAYYQCLLRLEIERKNKEPTQPQYLSVSSGDQKDNTLI